MLRPPPLRPGSTVRIVAPSSPFDCSLLRRGMGWLGTRYKVEFEPGLFARHGFLAGDDARRSAELNRALADPKAAAVVAARGGYGLARIVPSLDLLALRRAPKWIVGFSDMTALHLEVLGAGMMTLHAQHAAGLGRGDAHARLAWLEALEQPERRQRFGGLVEISPGRACGPLWGGNLTVLFAAHAARRLALPEGAVLLLEDVSETSYRIDRMLTALLQAGALAPVSAVVLGEFFDCSSSKYRVPTEQVLSERLTTLGVPVLGGLPVGHGRNNAPLALGTMASVDTERGELVLDPGADQDQRA